MRTTAGWTRLLALVIVIAIAIALGSSGCGTSSNKRDRESCDSCNPAQIDSGCVQACLPFCVPDDPDCTNRCNVQCDRCKADLGCHACISNCTGTVARCAPVDELLTCEDGVF